jgi:hypothetical protein
VAYNNNWAKIDWPDSAQPSGRDLNDIGASLRTWGWGQTAGTVTINANENTLSNLGNTSLIGRLDAAAAIPVRLTGSGFKYLECESPHLAWYKKTGAYNFYWRRSSDGHSGSSGEETLMTLDDNGLLSVASVRSALTVPSGSKLYVDCNNLGGTPSFALCIGDSDTGLHSVSDGQLDFYANNTRILRLALGLMVHTPPGPYADNAAAIAAGLSAGCFYRTSDGSLKVVF